MTAVCLGMFNAPRHMPNLMKAKDAGKWVWTSRHSRLTSDLTLSLTGNVTPGLHIISFESPTLHREDHAAQGVRNTPQKQQQSACQICTNASQHKSHHIAICVLQIEYNDRMGRLEKAQTSQESPWPGSSALEHQICKYACKKLPLDSLKS